jgi:SpoVK/Ycf46/Vps4 family AAA+-type ATPase
MVEDVDAMTGNESLRAGFLNIIDGLTGVSGVLTVASTNSPDKLDPAFSSRPSRFDELYLFRNPDDKMREKILRNKLGDDAKDRFDIPHLVQETNGFSAAFVQEVVVKAMREAFLSGKQVTSTLLRNSVKKVRKHVTDSSENWTGRIGFS